MNQFSSTIISNRPPSDWYGVSLVPVYSIMGGLISQRAGNEIVGSGEDFNTDDFNSDDFA